MRPKINYENIFELLIKSVLYPLLPFFYSTFIIPRSTLFNTYFIFVVV